VGRNRRRENENGSRWIKPAAGERKRQQVGRNRRRENENGSRWAENQRRENENGGGRKNICGG
jgi:hypothetical protein